MKTIHSLPKHLSSPGAWRTADSQETALKRINEAMQLWIDTASEFGDPIPQPKGERLMFA